MVRSELMLGESRLTMQMSALALVDPFLRVGCIQLEVWDRSNVARSSLPTVFLCLVVIVRGDKSSGPRYEVKWGAVPYRT